MRIPRLIDVLIIVQHAPSRVKTPLFGLFRLAPKLFNLDLDLLVHTSLQFRAVAKHEENLQPNKHGGKEDCLDEVIEKGRGTAFVNAVTDELEDPTDDVKSQSSLKSRRRVLLTQVIAKSSTADAEGG